MTGELVPPDQWQPGPRWQLSLLGGVRLHDADTVHTRFATRAIAALLARLALWPQRDHPREELIELLWPGVDAPTGRRRLRQALSLLRAVLEPPQGPAVPVLQADRLSVRLVPGTIACDVHAFEAQWRSGRREAALASFRGELMPGYFDEWIHDERTRLNHLHDRLTTAAAQDEPPRARPPAAAASRLAAAEPTPPVGPGALGAAPPPLLRTTLPGYLTRYVASAQPPGPLLPQLLAHRLVTLLGPGGSGKTRQAVALAAQLSQPATPGAAPLLPPPFAGVWFVALAAVHTREQLLGALHAALQINPPTAPTDDDSTDLDALVARLEGGPALLVLDNVEQLVGVANGVLQALTTALPQLHVLMTSRCLLGLDGERAVLIEPLPLPPARATLAQAAASPAVVLFVDRACAVRVDFHLSARNHAAVVDLVRALEGMPLAIELAASRIRAFSPAEMLARLRAPAQSPGATPGLDLLARPAVRGTDQSRHASMLRTIAWSWQQLDPAQQALAAAMAAFPGGCSAPMLARMGLAGDVATGLEQLHAQSLIQWQRLAADPADGHDDAPRFRLYEPIREYASAQLDAAQGRRFRAGQRAWALAWLRALPATPPLAAVRAELTNLAAACASAAADQAGDDAVALLVALRPLHEGVMLPSEALVQAQQAVETCTDPDRRVRGWTELVPLLFAAGLSADAQRLADQAVAAAPLPGPLRAGALVARALLHWRGGFSSPQDQWHALEEALRLADAAGEQALAAEALSLMGRVKQLGERDAEGGRQLALRAVALWEALGNRHGLNYARHTVAVLEFRCGRHDEALALWDLISSEAAVLQDTRRMATALSSRCAALSEMHRWPQARQALQQSLQQHWQAMRLYEVSFDLWNLPRVLAHLRRPEAAQRLMAFIAQHWQSRVGKLTDTDRRYVRRVDRLVARQLDAPARAAAAARGRQMTLADAVALALAD